VAQGRHDPHFLPRAVRPFQVTVLEMSNNRVTQVRTSENDGYSAVQVAYGSRRNSRVIKRKRGITPKRV